MGLRLIRSIPDQPKNMKSVWLFERALSQIWYLCIYYFINLVSNANLDIFLLEIKIEFMRKKPLFFNRFADVFQFLFLDISWGLKWSEVLGKKELVGQATVPHSAYCLTLYEFFSSIKQGMNADIAEFSEPLEEPAYSRYADAQALEPKYLDVLTLNPRVQWPMDGWWHNFLGLIGSEDTLIASVFWRMSCILISWSLRYKVLKAVVVFLSVLSPRGNTVSSLA